jgi:phosphoribosyl 1,2-cyclic phosphodiesterase
MPIRFTVLASGSAGNSSLVQIDGFGLLLDAGLGPRQLARRLSAVGASWAQVNAVLLSHTHSDHWHDRTLAHLQRHGIPLYCHAEHADSMLRDGSAFAPLQSAGLVRWFREDEALLLTPMLRCRTLPLSHDGGPTFGFRFDAEPTAMFGEPSALAYAADLGTWTPELAQALADVDVLALEFNHDVGMQHASGRSFHLIRRILGDRGHLSNVQAAALVQETLRRSAPGRLRHLVQLHLSRDCNQPELARRTALAALGTQAVEVHTASQDIPGPAVSAGAPVTIPLRPRTARPRRINGKPTQPWLPGMDPFESSASF